MPARVRNECAVDAGEQRTNILLVSGSPAGRAGGCCWKSHQSGNVLEDVPDSPFGPIIAKPAPPVRRLIHRRNRATRNQGIVVIVEECRTMNRWNLPVAILAAFSLLSLNAVAQNSQDNKSTSGDPAKP